jgi:acyl-CoA reductase-like NAD-dependent aldehyde dehydrogenase
MVQGVAIDDDGCIVNMNPATGEEILPRILCTSTAELESMVQAAVTAHLSWSQVPTEERIHLLRESLKRLSLQATPLAETIVAEMGKPLAEAIDEVRGATQKDEYLDLLQTSLDPQRRGSCVVVRHPLGVVAVLSPWNFPCDEILLLALPALASGNTVIVKPSEVAPQTGELVVSTIAEGLPPGVLQLAQGDGVVGSKLVQNSAVNMVAMTGSSATGKKILESAAPQLKRFVLELGGKDPMIVFEDADLEKAAADAVAYSLSNSGQVCCSIERIYVAQSIYEEFSQRVAQHAAQYTVGNGSDAHVKVGPLVSAVQRDKVAEHVDDAIAKGARVLFRSAVPAGLKGHFYPVTVLADVRDGMRAYREETFGPVVSLTPFDGSEAEAIRLANDTMYGLASCIYTTDMDRAERVAMAIDAGQVGINCYSLEHMDVGCPWVGHKSSGFGYHSGPEGFHQFSIPKSLVYRPG